MKRFFNNIVVKFILITLVFFHHDVSDRGAFRAFWQSKARGGRSDHAVTASAVHHVAVQSR